MEEFRDYVETKNRLSELGLEGYEGVCRLKKSRYSRKKPSVDLKVSPVGYLEIEQIAKGLEWDFENIGKRGRGGNGKGFSLGWGRRVDCGQILFPEDDSAEEGSDGDRMLCGEEGAGRSESPVVGGVCGRRGD